MPVKKGPDGRKFHMSSTGVDLVADSSESEEELQPSLPAIRGSVAFLNVLDEAKTGKQITEPIVEARHQNTPANRSHFRPRLPGQAVVHNWMPESHPADGTQAYATLEKKVKENRDGLLRAAVKVCKTGHVVLVIHWSPSDPLNRRGTWSLEVFDCRLELWGEFGVEAHEQCRSLSTADDIVNALAKAMVERWETILPTNKESSNPICEWNDDKRKLLNGKFSKRLLPSLREIERELRPLAVYAIGQLPRGQGGGSRDDQNDKDDNDKKDNGNQKDQKATKEELQAQKKAAQDRARLAHLRKIMGDQKSRQDLDREYLGNLEVLTRDAQRRANGTGGIWDSNSRSFIPRSNLQGVSALGLTDEVEDVPITLSKTETDGQKKQPGSDKATKTEEEDADLKRIRAAARKDRERQEREERAEEERQRELAAQQEEAELRERTGFEDTDSDEDINAAVVEALENDSFEPEASENEPAKISQEEIGVVESATDSSADGSGLEDRKQRQEPRAPVTPATPDSSDSDSVRSPRFSTPVEIKAKPATANAKSETKEAKSARESKAERTKSVRTKDSNASKGIEKKKHKSEELVSNSDLENDETDDVKLSSDKLQAEDVSVETTETSSTTVHSEHSNNAVKESIETTTIAVKLHQHNGSAERTAVTATTTAKSDSFPNNEIAIKHTTHTETLTQLNVPHQELPHNSPPSSPERVPQDGFDTPTNALGIEVHTAPPLPSPSPSPTPSASPSSPRKRKTPPPDDEEESRVDSTAKQGNSSASSPPPPQKKAKISPPSSSSPAQDGDFPTATGPLDLAPDDVAGSAGCSTSSSSGRKRKVAWAEEEEGEVSISPGKRRMGSEEVKPEDEERVHAGLSVGLCDVEKLDGEDDAESWESLFDGYASRGGKGDA